MYTNQSYPYNGGSGQSGGFPPPTGPTQSGGNGINLNGGMNPPLSNHSSNHSNGSFSNLNMDFYSSTSNNPNNFSSGYNNSNDMMGGGMGIGNMSSMGGSGSSNNGFSGAMNTQQNSSTQMNYHNFNFVFFFLMQNMNFVSSVFNSNYIVLFVDG